MATSGQFDLVVNMTSAEQTIHPNRQCHQSGNPGDTAYGRWPRGHGLGHGVTNDATTDTATADRKGAFHGQRCHGETPGEGAGASAAVARRPWGRKWIAIFWFGPS